MANTVDGGGWFSLREAAGQLGISERTARRRVKQGDLRGRQVASPRGPMWEVWLDDAAPAATVDGQASQVAMVEALRMMEQLQAELLRRTEAAAMWQARAEMLGHQLRALQAPADAPESRTARNLGAQGPDPPREPPEPDPEPQPPPVAEPIPPEPDERPWWRRVWAALLGAPG